MVYRDGQGGDQPDVMIGTGYPQFQLSKALRNAWATGDATANAKVEKWQQVIDGMFAGALNVGSRTPIAETPEWVTLEVVTGGFVTGNMLAGGALADHEEDLAKALRIPIDTNARAALNGYFLSDDGQDRLRRMIVDGRFRIDVPEESALLIVAWLLDNGDVATAQAVLDELIPFFDRLRFFPQPSDQSADNGEQVFLQSAGQTAERLRKVSPQRRMDAQDEAIRIWTPLYDRAVALLLQTVDGEPPRVAQDMTGKPVRDAHGKYQVDGGQPCAVRPDDWDAAARVLLGDYSRYAIQHRLCKAWHRETTPFRRCLAAIEVLANGGAVADGERNYLRIALARFIAKRGVPGSDTYRAFRRRRSLLLLNLESQVKLEELPWVAALSAHRQDSVSSRKLAATVMTDVVATALHHFPHAILPNKLLQELRGLADQAKLDMPIVDEIAADIFIGRFSAKFVRAARIAGELMAGTLYARYYGIAFDQVRQLPVRADPQPDFPQAPPSYWIRLVKFARRPESASERFADYCKRRAGPAASGHLSVAANGTIVEQSQILTTQNLAAMFRFLDLKPMLGPRLADLVRSCFEWICRRQQIRLAEYHARLVMLKNTAYAWRQMIFFLSLLEATEQTALLDWMDSHIAAQSPEFQTRFRPALAGLRAVAAGKDVTDDGGQRFLGWTVGQHWLMPVKNHRAGAGVLKKTEFPSHWDDERIIHQISDIATDPSLVRQIDDRETPYVVGTRDGVEIRANFFPDDHAKAGQITTGYPINVPENPGP